jgi:hypothetical protein
MDQNPSTPLQFGFGTTSSLVSQFEGLCQQCTHPCQESPRTSSADNLSEFSYPSLPDFIVSESGQHAGVNLSPDLWRNNPVPTDGSVCVPGLGQLDGGERGGGGRGGRRELTPYTDYTLEHSFNFYDPTQPVATTVYTPHHSLYVTEPYHNPSVEESETQTCEQDVGRGERPYPVYSSHFNQIPLQTKAFYSFVFIRRSKECIDPFFLRLFNEHVYYFKCQARIDFHESLARAAREENRIKDIYWYGVIIFRFDANHRESEHGRKQLVRSVERFLQKSDSDYVAYLTNFEDVRSQIRQIVRSHRRRSIFLTPIEIGTFLDIPTQVPHESTTTTQ